MGERDPRAVADPDRTTGLGVGVLPAFGRPLPRHSSLPQDKLEGQARVRIYSELQDTAVNLRSIGHLQKDRSKNHVK